MSRYICTECPVCKREFVEGDDIVTCPECGTPHHRECYDLIGKCVNNGLHGSGYTFELKNNEEAPQQETAVVGEYYNPNKDEEKEKPPVFSTQFDINNIEAQLGTNTEKIDGNAAVDVASTIRVNIPRFMAKFKQMEMTNKKISWNWGAFFFGGLYYLFRKMYKQGVSLVFAFITIIYGCDTLLFKFAPKFVEAVQSAAETYASGGTLDPNMLITSDMTNAYKITYATFGLILIIRIISALFADYCYKGTVADIIAKVNEKLEKDMTFVQTPMMMQDAPQLSQEQMRKMYLARKGGVSLFTPTLVAFAIYNIMYLL